MSGALFHLPNARQLSSAGAILPGWKAQFYQTNTTTPAAVYADGDLETPLTNPVEADAAGQMAPIYLDPDVTYRVQIYDANDVLISDVDPIDVSRGSGSGGSGPAIACGYVNAAAGPPALWAKSTGVASVANPDPGLWVITFTSGFFSATPVVVAALDGTSAIGAAIEVQYQSGDATTAYVTTSNRSVADGELVSELTNYSFSFMAMAAEYTGP